MKTAMPEIQNLAETILSVKQIELIQSTLDNIKNNPKAYSIYEFNKLDESVGGVGGYCLPINPIYNPFPHNFIREVFRPLQYAYSDIFYGIINHSRFSVWMSGLHLESTVRIILKSKCFLGNLRYYNTTLGKAVFKLKQLNILPDSTIQALFAFIPVLNKAKHDINMDDSRARLFLPSDALFSYIIARILGLELISYFPPNMQVTKAPEWLIKYSQEVNLKESYI